MALKVAAVVLGLLALAHAGPIQNDKIIGGHDTDIREVPYQVSLVSAGPFVHCGGSIINENTILTAAHCAGGSFDVRVGVTRYDDPNNIHRVSEVIVHPNYNFPLNDFAIVKLADRLTFSDTVKPIGLAQLAPAANTPALVSGWGQISDPGGPPVILQSITLPITDRQWCEESYGVDDSVICAGPRAPDQGVCFGDSGGPLVANNVLVGVVSFVSSSGCAIASSPSGFANVANGRAWIESHL